METQQQTEAAMGAFGFVMMGLFAIVAIISFILWLKVLIALFKKEGAGLGILGLICFIYLYIWGWMKSKELNLKSTMIWLTLAWIASIVLWFVAVAGAIGIMASNPEFQKEFQRQMEEAQRQQQLQQQGETAPAPQN
jgi:uncharacterized membrane protein